jgi:hypothetical protein
MAQPACWLTGLSHLTQNIILFIIWKSSVDRKFHYRYKLGDLVEFQKDRITEEYLDFRKATGIVVEQSYRMTTDNVYRIQVGDEKYWVSEPRITLLSSVGE